MPDRVPPSADRHLLLPSSHLNSAVQDYGVHDEAVGNGTGGPIEAQMKSSQTCWSVHVAEQQLHSSATLLPAHLYMRDV